MVSAATSQKEASILVFSLPPTEKDAHVVLEELILYFVLPVLTEIYGLLADL